MILLSPFIPGDYVPVKYKQFGFLGTYDTLSEIVNRKREFVCRRAEVELRLTVLRTCTCGVVIAGLESPIVQFFFYYVGIHASEV